MTGKGERRAERRLITCLFIDIVGSSQLTVTLGPERMKRALDAAFANLREIVEAEGGTVEKYVGDEIYALFGAPVAHADDPLRALRAAEAATRWARASGDGGSPLSIRAGIETGEALVDLTATELERQQMSVGACVNIAARLQQAAEPGHVLVGPTCHGATTEQAEFASLGEISLKGVGTLPAWSLLRVIEGRTADLPFVGREAELDLLAVAQRRARSGRSVLGLVSGAPGQGKTRLVQEFIRRLEEDVRVLAARCRPGGEIGAETPLRQLLVAEIGEATPDRVNARAAELFDDPFECRRVASALCHSVGLALSEELASLPIGERTDEITNAWRRYLAALARATPLLVWIEDVHWAEPQLVRLLDRLTLANETPLLVVATARPEFAEHAGLRPSGDRFFVEVGGLDPESARALAEHAGGADPRAVERAEGNPLFIVELARSQRARGDELPISLQGVIGARLDELAVEDRGLLLRAAVAGERFSVRDVALLAGRNAGDVASALQLLADLLYLRPSAAGYRFHHALVRDVAYGRLPIAERMRLHALYARAGVHPEDAEALAHHWWEALRPPDAEWVWEGEPEQPAMRQEAFGALLAAGRRYADRFAAERASEALERALLFAAGDAAIAEAERSLGNVHKRSGAGDAAWAHYLRARDASGRSGAGVPASLYADMLELAIYTWGMFRERPAPDLVRSLLEEGEEVARRSGDRVALARLLALRAHLEESLPPTEEALRIVDESADARPFAGLLLHIASQQYIEGDLARARRTIERVRALVAAGASVDEASALHDETNVAFALGEIGRASESADRQLATLAGRGPHLRTHALNMKALVLSAAGDWAGVTALAREVAKVVDGNPGTAFCVAAANTAAYGAVAQVLGGRPEEAQPLLALIDRVLSPGDVGSRAAAQVLPFAVLGRAQEALRAIGAARLVSGTLGRWPLDVSAAVALVILERWDELEEKLEALRPLRERSPYVAALLDAVEEERGAAAGGPAPRHEALRALGYIGRSQLLRFRPATGVQF